ncbi:hypothetical protein [Croceivirga sp. JEA036]|uniref:hypothetical protein n=1 Tax=Croceivirga sp. JEA036 TaxID=2721162 RepID=UPI00143899BE|nr:hypothetical protein [Croceivirga sp. JEA036]NJB38198.1 hypothetical protein [Croceivirga sp. JEA036]
MNTDNFFKNKSIDLFHPEGIELISTILFGLGFNYDNLKSDQARKEGIYFIKNLIDLELIEIYHWGNYHESLKNVKMTNEETIKNIEKVWFVGADVPDFYGMLILKYKDWYVDALKKEGLELTGRDWKSFVTEKIGDLEKWIEENRPKNTNHNTV